MIITKALKKSVEIQLSLTTLLISNKHQKMKFMKNYCITIITYFAHYYCYSICKFYQLHNIFILSKKNKKNGRYDRAITHIFIEN